jgi:hypothetical protein
MRTTPAWVNSMAVAGVAGGHDAIEHVDAALTPPEHDVGSGVPTPIR